MGTTRLITRGSLRVRRRRAERAEASSAPPGWAKRSATTLPLAVWASRAGEGSGSAGVFALALALALAILAAWTLAAEAVASAAARLAALGLADATASLA